MTPADYTEAAATILVYAIRGIFVFSAVVLLGRFLRLTSKPTPPQTVTTAPQPNAKHEPRPCPHHWQHFRVGGKVDAAQCKFCYEVQFS